MGYLHEWRNAHNVHAMHPLPSEYLSTGQVARMLGVDPSTVTRWDESGKLRPALTLPSGHRRYRRSDIEALLKASA